MNEGRVAHISSDHIWLWSRGYDGGGPHAELMKRTIHWLMKEPELDERALRIEVSDTVITLQKNNFASPNRDIVMTTPSGTEETITLAQTDDGHFLTQIQAEEIGVYRFLDAAQEYHAVVGQLNPPELLDAIASEDKLKGLNTATGGRILWAQDDDTPALRYAASRENGLFSGASNALHLRANQSYSVKESGSRPALPGWAYLILMAGLLVLAWWYEGKTQK